MSGAANATSATTATSAATAPGSQSQPLLGGPILPILLRFALPNMAAMLATALATVAETGFVGSFEIGRASCRERV